MDDTQQSRSSDAAATRKRRSSILKSQRPPRTPFSELEFNVATPTDTAKSRRVSFSRRTGVAEFVTNEATTTWKTFYEEHNKSLESSGNESGANPPRPPVGHIGKRIFDQQFQEVEAVDFASTMDNHSRNINTSMNNVKFTQQLNSPENTGDKLTAPQQNFEMSAFTDHQSKLFGDDLAIPTIGEMSGRIEVNFSTIQAIAEIKDDLDEIQKDLERAQSNVVCPGPFTGRKSMSEYIEVDLNATHVTMRNDDDDMSITDTIHSPKVQDVSKPCNTSHVDKKASISKDWVADKENIALNPYVAPNESINFAVNDESDKILVFDGKRLTVSSDKDADIILKGSTENVKPAAPMEIKPARKTIVLNVNDDLPNFVDDPMSTSAGILGSASFKLSVMYDDDDISITQPLVSKVSSMPEKNVTLVNETEVENISLTQVVNNVILPAKTEKRKTIVYESDNCDISMTQALPAQIIGTNPENKVPERRRTILYENDTGNISITQAIPANIIMNNKPDLDIDKSKTQVFNNIEADISMTQMVPANLILPTNVDLVDLNKTKPLEAEKRKTIVFENDDCDISMTQVLPSKILAPEENKPETGRRRTILYDDDMGNISVTQAIPSNIILNDKSEILNYKSKTVDNIEMDISMTQAVPANLLLPANGDDKRKTIVFENKDCDISVTQALPSKIIIENQIEQPGRRRTILYENDTGDISMTQAIPANIIVNVSDKINITTSQDGKSKVVVESSPSHISDTEILSPKVLSIIANMADKNKTIIAESDLADISITRTVPTNILLPEANNEKRKTIVYDDATGNISITQGLPANICMPEKVEAGEKNKSINAADISITPAVLVNVVIVNNTAETRKPIAYDMQNAITDKSKEENNADSVSVSNTSGVQDVIPIIADAILPVKDNAENEMDVENDMIGIKNDLVENMSATELSPANVSQDKSKTTVTENNRISSSDSLIYIIRDTEGQTQTDRIDEKQNKSLKWHSDVPMLEHSPLALGYNEDIDEEVTVDLPKKIEELKSVVHNEKNTTKTRVCEESPDNVSMKSYIINKDTSKRFRDANDTDELLEMLSDLTDKTRLSKEPEEPKEAVEAKEPKETVEANEPRRLSVVPSRLSIALSREDLLNNISMAQAALQRSIQIDDSMEDDTTTDTPVQVSMPQNKAARVSNEVVKKLHFEEDESTSDASIKSDLKGTPLKKTAFGETSYMTNQPNKVKVIPSYLKDVSDGIKALMHDLVKPTADNIPFQTEKALKREPSTCSNQIQANLVTSSQIDLETEPNLASDSMCDMEKISLQSSNRSHSLRSSLKSDSQYDMPLSFRPKRYSGSTSPQDKVILFDPNNPLNNILLTPIDFSEVHRYEPPEPVDVMNVDTESHAGSKEKESHEELTTQIVGSVTVTHARQSSGDTVPDKSDVQSVLSNTSKDDSVSVRVCELKDTKVNTVITMKANKELLEASSSLTLVDDALAKSTFDIDFENVPSKTFKAASPVKVIFQNDDPKTVSLIGDSDLTSNDESADSVKKAKGKKRNYSPTKRDRLKSASLDVTPKPTVKMQKKSSSPNAYVDTDVSLKFSSPSQFKTTDEEPQKLKAEKENISAVYAETSDGTECDKKRSPRKPKSPKAKKLGANVTVQQLLTECDIHPDMDQDALNKQIIQALSGSDSSTAPNTSSLTDINNLGVKSPDIVSSFTSSKNQNEVREDCSVTTTETRTTFSRCQSMKIDWQPQLSETSSNMITECESSVNVVAKIDMLPFMGSHECEWEASALDTWCFRLLYGRLRLTVRLTHRHDNATRTRVRADTPVLGVTLDTAHRDKKNSVATLCVGFAAEAMRYHVRRGCARAGDVPSLLRRCAGVARVALRWGRAMHEARLHLAYTLSDDGCLALKVANIPLRSVWEVTMRLELVQDARGTPWPRACDARATRVVADARVRDDELRDLLQALPQDWGHAPRAIWKIFRYLKNKTREDYKILGL